MSMPGWVRTMFPQQAREFEREDAAKGFYTEEDSPTFPATRTTRDGQIDAYSDTWIFVSKWAESELVRARDANDSTKRTEAETAVLRGRIKALKELLKLHEPRERKRPQRDIDEY